MTGQQFIDLCNSNDVVELEEDVDFNDYVFTNTVKIQNTTINGNGHKISNIQNESNMTLFTFNSSTVFNNVIINNVYVPLGTLMVSGVLNECTVTGMIKELGKQTTVYNKCSVNVERLDTSNVVFQDSYIIINGIFNPSNDFNVGSCTGCYIKGTITFSGISGETYAITSRLDNCCFNVDIESDKPLNFTYNLSTNLVSVINKSKINVNVSTSSEKYVLVTDNEMRNAQALYNKGFSIYVPQV